MARNASARTIPGGRLRVGHLKLAFERGDPTLSVRSHHATLRAHHGHHVAHHRHHVFHAHHAARTILAHHAALTHHAARTVLAHRAPRSAGPGRGCGRRRVMCCGGLTCTNTRSGRWPITFGAMRSRYSISILAIGGGTSNATSVSLFFTSSAEGIAIDLHHLRLALHFICPATDWTWLAVISKRVSAQRERPSDRALHSVRARNRLSARIAGSEAALCFTSELQRGLPRIAIKGG